MQTISQLARRFGLSRSALLYYGRIDLLQPSGRSAANYRLYNTADERRLAQICLYRQAGLPLQEIRSLLHSSDQQSQILTRRLAQLNQEMALLREQSRVILRLLKHRRMLRQTRVLDKQRWVEILAATGLSEEDMHRWHVEFERMSPEAHGDFLEGLGISKEEVSAIRRWSREQGAKR
jgi:MerR family transcriptional regulator, thiopeptide resistance regulator